MLETAFEGVDFSPLQAPPPIATTTTTTTTTGRIYEEVLTEMSLPSFAGYLRSWSPYRRLLSERSSGSSKEEGDPVARLEEDLTRIVGTGQSITIATKFFAVVARKKE